MAARLGDFPQLDRAHVGHGAREGVRVTQDAAEALLTLRLTVRGPGPRAAADGARSAPGLPGVAAPPDLTAAGAAAGTATARARPGGPGPRRRGCCGSPRPGVRRRGPEGAPLLWERAGAWHQRQVGVRLDLHGVYSGRDRPGAACPARRRSPLGGGGTGSCVTATATCPRTRCRSCPCPPWLPPCEIWTGHFFKELRGVEDREDA